MRHWDDTWMEVAQVVALRSLCSRAQVGCVIASAENRIVATGYNGPPRGFDHRDRPCTEWCDRAISALNGHSITTNYSDCPSSHAESNAFMAADRSAWQGGTLYVTGHVCPGCTKLIANSGLARVVVQPDARPRVYRESEESYRFIRSMGIGVEIVEPQMPPDPDSLPTISMAGAKVIQVKTIGGQWMNVAR
jgi:dCMP deaminase